MHLNVQYIQKRKGPSWRYRRRVPKHIVDRIGKAEIIVQLGRNEREALIAYASAHADVEDLFSSPQIERTPSSPPVTSSPECPRL